MTDEARAVEQEEATLRAIEARQAAAASAAPPPPADDGPGFRRLQTFNDPDTGVSVTRSQLRARDGMTEYEIDCFQAECTGQPMPPKPAEEPEVRGPESITLTLPESVTSTASAAARDFVFVEPVEMSDADMAEASKRVRSAKRRVVAAEAKLENAQATLTKARADLAEAQRVVAAGAAWLTQ